MGHLPDHTTRARFLCGKPRDPAGPLVSGVIDCDACLGKLGEALRGGTLYPTDVKYEQDGDDLVETVTLSAKPMIAVHPHEPTEDDKKARRFRCTVFVPMTMHPCTCPQPVAPCEYNEELCGDTDVKCTCCPRCRYDCYQDV